MMMQVENVMDLWDQEGSVQVEPEAENVEPYEDDSALYSKNHDLKVQVVEQDLHQKDQCPNVERGKE